MHQYREWSKKAAENAGQLAVEARLLFDAGHLARAYYLSHMVLEESAKSVLLWSMGENTIPGVELPRFKKLLTNHKKKIEFIVKYATANSAELKEKIGDLLPDLVSHINDLKNNTMYVSLEGDEILTPSDKISGIDVRVHVAVAEGLAGLANSLLTIHSSRTPIATRLVSA